MKHNQKKEMAGTKMVAKDYYRSEIQRYLRARFVAPKENAIRDNKQGKLKIKKNYLNSKILRLRKMGASLEK